MLRQEMDQADSERDEIHQKLMAVSEQRVQVENELNQLGESDSEEKQRLEHQHENLLAKEDKLRLELENIHDLLDDIQAEMQTLLVEEIQLETQRKPKPLL